MHLSTLKYGLEYINILYLFQLLIFVFPLIRIVFSLYYFTIGEERNGLGVHIEESSEGEDNQNGTLMPAIQYMS
jgi:hypothetical protein